VVAAVVEVEAVEVGAEAEAEAEEEEEAGVVEGLTPQLCCVSPRPCDPSLQYSDRDARPKR
jgi:hypothetical protein